MKKVRCLNGHFFDSDTYDKCPLCNSVKVEENDANGVESAKSVTQEKKHLFPWMKDNKKYLRGWQSFLASYQYI